MDCLIITKQLTPQFSQFLLDNLVPVLRAHRAVVLVFMDLVNREDDYKLKEKKEKVQVKTSDVFTRTYVPEKVKIVIPPDPLVKDPNGEDPYLDSFSYSIRNMAKVGKVFGPRIEHETREWFFTPLTHLYRLRMHSDMLGVTSSYTPVMSPKLLKTADSKLYTHRKNYSEDNLLESVILGMENVIMESQKWEDKIVYKARFEESLPVLESHLHGMLREGLVTSKRVAETLRRVKLRGEAYGIYNGDSEHN